MSFNARAKNFFRERMSYSMRLFGRRLFVNLVGAVVRLSARVYNFGGRVLALAVTHGLDLHRAWDVKPAPRPPFAEQYGAHDFLLLMDAISGRGGRAPAPDRLIRTSIILLCHNEIELTFQCLRSLLREVALDDAEIIVVDNASSDETRRVLSHFGALIRTIRLDSHVGRAGGNNEGARAARGEYLVFLGNDTVVLPGWLKSLCEVAENEPQAGAVGSMLVYPDWTLREAGGIVWRSGEASPYGQGKSPEDPRYNFSREADYCNGASLLIRRDLFERLGGFDARYAPARYEDADICFGVRSLGYKVIYQPHSRIIHFEGATVAGRDARTGFEQHRLLNREKFREKWRETLEREHFERGAVAIERAADRRAGPAVLVVSDRVPTPDRDAGSARMVFTLGLLARWCRPVFVSLSKERRPEYERQLWQLGVETIGSADFLDLAERGVFEVAILSRPDVAEAVLPALRSRNASLKIIFDMVDTYFIRLEREHRLTLDERTAEEARRYRELELRLVRASDLVWCASSEDKRAVAHEAPEVRIEVIPTIHPLRARGESFAGRAHLLFLGNLSHRPNADAVHHFMRDIFPLVKRALPGVKFYVVGDKATPEIAAYASADVEVLGYVPDIEPLFRNCRLMVVPLRYGAGIKGKLGESLSYGLPVVTTSTGAEGFGLTDGVEALIADDPQTFAAAVVRAYEQEDLWERLAERGRRHVEKHFTPEVVAEVVNSSVRGLASTKTATRTGGRNAETGQLE
jgi:GT2 family glycosyltransferase/glycosyltransferase involved in cell wall biosynthesis